MIITEIKAHTIMGAFSMCYSEGTNDINREIWAKHEVAEWCAAEEEIVREIYQEFPHVVKEYSWLPSVKKVLSDQSID